MSVLADNSGTIILAGYSIAGPVHVFAALCVIVYAINRFQQPPEDQSQTTRLHWRLALIGYGLTAVVMWALLTLVITSEPTSLSFLLAGADQGVPEDVRNALLKGFAPPLMAALILTLLLPNLPIVSRIDASLQRAFKNLAAIPRNALRLSLAIRRAPFSVPSRLKADIRKVVEEQGINPVELFSAPQDSIAWEWLRIVTMRVRLMEETDDEVIDPDTPRRTLPLFVRHQYGRFSYADAAYRRLAVLAKVSLTTEPLALSGEGADVVRNTFETEAKSLFRSMRHVIACGVLVRNNSVSSACHELEDWGFRINMLPRQRLLGVDDVIGLALGMILIVTVALFSVGPQDASAERILGLSFMIGLTMTAAAVVAGLPRTFFGVSSANRGYPFRHYLVAALLAAGIWLLAQYVRMLVTNPGQSGVSALFDQIFHRGIWPYMLIPATAAFGIAFLLDLKLPASSGRPLRLIEGGLLAVVLGMAGASVALLLSEIREGRAPPVEVLASVQAGIGFVLGAVVPHLYRRIGERREASEDEAAFPSFVPAE